HEVTHAKRVVEKLLPQREVPFGTVQQVVFQERGEVAQGIRGLPCGLGKIGAEVLVGELAGEGGDVVGKEGFASGGGLDRDLGEDSGRILKVLARLSEELR